MYLNLHHSDTLLVRRDAKHILIGSADSSLHLDKIPAVRKVAKLWSKLVVQNKIYEVIINPTKIMFDALMNMSYLASAGVPLADIVTKPAGLVRDMNAFTNYLNMYLLAKYEHAKHNNAKSKAKLSKAFRMLQSHRLYDPYRFGLLNGSATQELTNSTDNLVSGMSKSAIQALDYLTTKGDRGNLNRVGKLLQEFSQYGVSTEDALIGIKEMIEDKNIRGKDNTSIKGGIAKGLGEIAKKLEYQKKSGKPSAWLQEVIGTPTSALAASGGHLTQLTDGITKVMYYENEVRLNKQKLDSKIKANKDSMTNKDHKASIEKLKRDAAYEANNAFVDYRVPLPPALQGIENLGITSYIHFILKMQVSLARLLVKKPVSAALGFVIGYGTGLPDPIASMSLLNMEDGRHLINTSLLSRIPDAPYPTNLF